MCVNGLEHARQELVCFVVADPTNLCELVLVAHEYVGASVGEARQIDHRSAGLRMDASPDLMFGRVHEQTGLLLDLANCRVGWCFAGFDLACDKGPRRVAVVAPSDKHAEWRGDDRRDDGLGLGASRLFGRRRFALSYQ